MDRQPITQAGYDKILAEIKQLEEVEMPQVREAIKVAREEGDLSENAEYHGQREQQGMLQAKIYQLKSRLSNCVIVKKEDLPKDVVGFGTIVTVKDLSDDIEEQYELVGPGEEDYSAEPMKILTSSPIAQALEGKKVGDQAETEIPTGTLRLEIVKIEPAE
ncbi:transcription elongation factor GreA [Stratiformator vulcanicus]|uniref:Transcription elongation factor GreA n=1 Tax=Stratiformator vulcanicus TaxID=2527980 RepID=A0A517R6S8_9PLAN|nr:transcription elongation factor GreA [Stratiformator vulcanicus]QDT39565.1 Transcription elongation factor GreA [Stratiformator vulcanicus]